MPFGMAFLAKQPHWPIVCSVTKQMRWRPMMPFCSVNPAFFALIYSAFIKNSGINAVTIFGLIHC